MVDVGGNDQDMGSTPDDYGQPTDEQEPTPADVMVPTSQVDAKADGEEEDSASDRLDDEPSSESELDASEAEDSDPTPAIQDFSYSARPAPAPAMDPAMSYELSRGVMSSRYAGATPSSQEQQSVASSSSFGQWISFDDQDANSPHSLDVPPVHNCTDASCQQLHAWKDARIGDLQRALDQMVAAMAIQQRDLAAQRALLARQSEHFTQLSTALQQEKVALERAISGYRSAPSTPRGSSAVTLQLDTRRSTLSTARSSPRLSSPPAEPVRSGTPSPAPQDKSKLLTTLDVRPATPQMPTICELAKFDTGDDEGSMVLSEVSLHDRDCEPSTATSTGTVDSSSDLLHGDSAPSTPSGDAAKRWSIGGRLRSIRWKAAV